MGLDCTVSLLFPSILLWFLLYIFSCRRSFLLVFWSLSLIVSSYIIVIFVFLWKEVSSGSSYSVMWTIPSLFTFYSFLPSLNDLKWTVFRFADFFFCQIASIFVLFVTFSTELLYFSTLEFPFGTFFNSLFFFLLIFSFCPWIIFFIFLAVCICFLLGFPSGSDGKKSACSAEDPGLIHRSG